MITITDPRATGQTPFPIEAMPLKITTADPKQLQRMVPGLPPEAIDELAGKARQVTYRPEEPVMGERDRWSPALVAEGTLRLAIRSRDGREATVRIFGRGVFLGLVAMFNPEYSNAFHERSIFAVTRTSLIFFDSPTVMRLAQKHGPFAVHLLRGTVEWGGSAIDAVGRYAFQSVRERLAGHLVCTATEDADGRLVTAATQQQLANAIGSVREVVARTLHELREDGLVDVSRAKVTLLDRERLARDARRVT